MTTSFEELLNSTEMLKKGDLVKGTVSRIDEDKVFVDVAGAQYDCVILKNQISRKFVNNISDVLNIGDEVEAIVTGVRADRERKTEEVPGVIYLSKKVLENKEYKKLLNESWEEITEKFEKGELVEATISKVTKAGLIADVKGIRAFVPASMVDNKFIKDLSIFLNNTYTFKIEVANKAEDKLILDRKSLLIEEEAKKMAEIFEKINVGDVLEGKVIRITNFGVFVNIGEIDGLVHISEISHSRFDKISNVIKVGDIVKVVILSVDEESSKISLSIKALLPTLWEVAKDKFNSGDVVEGVVKNITEFGAFVEISEGVEGLVHISQLSHDRIEKVEDVLNSGETVSVKILDIDFANERISLSIKELLEKPKKVETKEEPDFDASYLKSEDTEFSLADKFKDLQ